MNATWSAKGVTQFFLCTMTAVCATVAIDPMVEHQTIEGFGAAISDQPGQYSTAMADMLVNDLGMSMGRLRIHPDLESTNDNGDPFSYQLSDITDNLGAASGRQLAATKQFVDAGLERLLLSPFSPPGWMKDMSRDDDIASCSDGPDLCGGHLDFSKVDEFTEHLTVWIKLIEQEMGDVVYAISPENEPEWEQWYISCVYTAEEMRDATKALGKRFETEGIVTKIAAAECVTSHNWGPYFGTTANDPVAAQYLDVLAVHAYENDGATAGDASPAKWRQVLSAASTMSIPVWQTETSGYANNWNDIFTYGTGIYTALKYGHVAAWIYLNTNNRADRADRSILSDGQTQHIFYMSKQYYRWIRPDAIMIDAISDDQDVFSLAFNHKANQTLTVVLMNNSTAARDVTLAGSGLPSFSAWRSSVSENCVDIGSSSGSLQLPPKSIVTLYGTGYIQGTGVAPHAVHLTPRGSVGKGVNASYNLRGRKMPNLGVHKPAKGVYFTVCRGRDGGLSNTEKAVRQ